ncbi:MAG: M28 family peptidase [Proteobacteria bacterium]|nr:M28 family peptidase [Pseudomonadota bacterium]
MHRTLLPAALALLVQSAFAQTPPTLLPQPAVAALANELSGETAKRNLEGLARLHRQRGSQGFHSAAELIAERARAYGLQHVEILKFPADGKIFYGTQRSRLAWDAEEGELSELKDGAEIKMASFAAEPVVLAEDSESADVTTELVDVGDGTKESDYAGKDVSGKIVLVAVAADSAQELAIGRFKAAGIISYAQNQKTAWSGDNDNLVRWGHLESFSSNPTFAFQVSLRTARALKDRLLHGEHIRLHARVKAGQHPAAYEIVTATIDGTSDAQSQIAFSCHLDHQRPGANDNASGCVTILEAARTLQKLIADGKLARPTRTLRFIWPPEIEGTTTLLNARPDLAQHIKAAIHMDMVGGGLDTKSVFHVTRGPMSLPSFVHDVAWSFASWINTESYQFAAGGRSDYPMIAPEGGKEPLRAEYSAYTMGSDHDVYQDSSFGIPSIYLNDWPDRYIHTNFDSAANIDPTKLKRAAFIGAASGYFLANFSTADVPATRRAVAVGRLLRAAQAMERGQDAAVLTQYETSIDAILARNDVFARAPARPAKASIFQRRPEPRGEMVIFGYDYFADHAKAAGIPKPKLLDYEGAWGSGEEYAYEALNFVDGSRSVRQITDALSVEYGPVSQELVMEYLQALEKIGILQRK